MKKFINLTINDLCQDTKRFIDDVQKEPDRSVPIIAVAFLDDVLGKLLEAYFIDNKKLVRQLLEYPGSLSNFAARVDVAHCLGLIPAKSYEDIIQIKKIRNKFSHSHYPISFDNHNIVDMCKKLNFSKLLNHVNASFSSPREQFLITAIMLVNTTLLKALSVEKIVKAKDYEIEEVVQV
jgi:DNA-binding MltR family transcriptional regulator